MRPKPSRQVLFATFLALLCALLLHAADRFNLLGSCQICFHRFIQGNCATFISNMQQLQDSVSKYVAAIDQQVCVPAHWPCVAVVVVLSKQYVGTLNVG